MRHRLLLPFFIPQVNRVILEMGLKNVADSKIGGTVVRGISGGEKRRVTIAIQLLQNPSKPLITSRLKSAEKYDYMI